ncbi:MAG: hypothetical protein ACXACY_13305 [Candidatus Hodarchaeales archaeon]|jgi:hypothetical protein
MKTELSISSEYCADWGLWEGVREVVQNFLDSRDLGFPGEVKYSAFSGTLTIRNDGTTIDRADIGLLGQTSKSSCPNTRGQFGEGLKIGILALVRAGLRVIIRSGSYAYNANIESSKRFAGKNVLTFHDRKIEHLNAVEIKVLGISQLNWNKLRNNFVDLRDKPFNLYYEDGTTGKVLFDEDDWGRVFVKGILVEQRDDLEFGYDFYNVGVDRDRRMVSDFDLSYHSSRILASAFQAGKLSGKKFLDMLSQGKRDLQYANYHVDQEMFEKIDECFASQHGTNAIPVRSQEDGKELEPYNIKPVIASEPLVRLFKEKGVKEKKIEEAKLAIDAVYDWDELEPMEQANILSVFEMFEKSGIKFSRQAIQFVDFINSELCGLFKQNEGGGGVCISIARKVIGRKSWLIKTLVKELAHYCGPDGCLHYENELHQLYGELITFLSSLNER